MFIYRANYVKDTFIWQPTQTTCNQERLGRLDLVTQRDTFTFLILIR